MSGADCDRGGLAAHAVSVIGSRTVQAVLVAGYRKRNRLTDALVVSALAICVVRTGGTAGSEGSEVEGASAPGAFSG